MNINIQKNSFLNIQEIWVNNCHTIEVVTNKDNRYKIISQENIRSNATPKYYAAYEKLISVNINGNDMDLWIRDSSLPQQYGDTNEECVTSALGWVDERC